MHKRIKAVIEATADVIASRDDTVPPQSHGIQVHKPHTCTSHGSAHTHRDQGVAVSTTPRPRRITRIRKTRSQKTLHSVVGRLFCGRQATDQPRGSASDQRALWMREIGETKVRHLTPGELEEIMVQAGGDGYLHGYRPIHTGHPSWSATDPTQDSNMHGNATGNPPARGYTSSQSA